MSAAKKKNSLGYKNFPVKETGKTGAPKSKAKSDSATKLKSLQDKYRSAPITLVPGKSKAVARTVTEKRSVKAAADKTSVPPTKKAFYLGGEPLAYQG